MNDRDRRYDDDEIIEESADVAEDGGELSGGDLFGPAQPGARYRCSEHGYVLARKVDWLPDGRPHCPVCGRLLTRE